MKNKKIYIQLGDEQNAHSEEQEKKQETVKDFAKDKIQDELIDSLTSNLQILDVTGNTAVISMPLQVVKIMSVLFKEIENQLENQQGITRC